MKQSVEEIKKLNEEISAARQDNLQLKVQLIDIYIYILKADNRAVPG